MSHEGSTTPATPARRAGRLAACSLQLAACSFLLTACATAAPDSAGETRTVRWIQLDEHQLQQTCRARTDRVRRPQLGNPATPLNTAAADQPRPVNGCYDITAGVCNIYTRRASAEQLLNPRYQQTIGHEVIHCFEGLFHD